MKMRVLILIVFVATAMIGLVSGGVRLDSVCKDKFQSIYTIEGMIDTIKQLRKFHMELYEGHTHDVRRCIEEYDSIVELETVISVEPRSPDVCHPNHIGKIIDYHNRFVKSSTKDNIKRVMHAERLPMVRHFFRRYALQVALTCRENLVANLEQATHDLDMNAQDFAQVMPWRESELDTVGNQHLNQTAVNARNAMMDDIKVVFDSIKTVDHLSWILDIGSDYVESEQKLPPGEERQALKSAIESNNERIVGLRGTCERMSQYYGSAVLSIVKLYAAGYRWDADHRYELELGAANDEQRQLVADWMAATLACNSILNVRDAIGADKAPTVCHQLARNSIEASQQFQVSEAMAKEHAWSKNNIRMQRMMMKIGKGLGHFSEQTKKLAESLGFHKAKHSESALAKKLGLAMDMKSGNRIIAASRSRELFTSKLFWLFIIGVAAMILAIVMTAVVHAPAAVILTLGVISGAAFVGTALVEKN